MSFAPAQLRKLRARLKPRHVKTREADGLTLHYLEGWHVIAEANRIFGFDGWDRETVASDCVWTRKDNGRYCAAYVARVRITVRAGDTLIRREGCGVGDSSTASPGQAHELAAKAAETDATKRALATFGNAFGLSLYGGPPEASASRDQRAGGPQSRDPSPDTHQRPQLDIATLPWIKPGCPYEQAPRTPLRPADHTAKEGDAADEMRRVAAAGPLASSASHSTPTSLPIIQQRTSVNGEHRELPLPPSCSVRGAAENPDDAPPVPEAAAEAAVAGIDLAQPHRARLSASARGAENLDATEPRTASAHLTTRSQASLGDSSQPAGPPDPLGGVIDKSALAYPEPRRIRDPDHLRFVASQPCLVCERTPAQAHHLRFAQPRALGRKVSDAFTVPLCALHHSELHLMGDERTFWTARKLNPLPVAEALWAAWRTTTPNRD